MGAALSRHAPRRHDARRAGGSDVPSQGALARRLRRRLAGRYQREAIGLNMQLVEHGARVFSNGASIGGVLEHPTQDVDPRTSGSSRRSRSVRRRRERAQDGAARGRHQVLAHGDDGRRGAVPRVAQVLALGYRRHLPRAAAQDRRPRAGDVLERRAAVDRLRHRLAHAARRAAGKSGSRRA
jgi:hypothetical protein